MDEVKGIETLKLQDYKDKKILAYYLHSREVKNKKGIQLIHKFQSKKDAKHFEFWGFTDFDSKISQIIPGTLVEITYLGMGKLKSGNNIHLVKLMQDRNDKIEITV